MRAPKERRIDRTLPEVRNAEEATAALSTIMTGVGEGQITPGEGAVLAEIVETQQRLVEAAMRTNPEKNSNSRVSRWKPNSQASCAGFVAPSAQCHAAPHRSRLPLRSQRPDEGGLENSAASEARPCPPFLLFACYLQAGRSGPVAGAVGHPQASRAARHIPAREPPARIKVIRPSRRTLTWRPGSEPSATSHRQICTFVHIIKTVSFEWNAAKANANLRKNGIDFADAATALEDESALTMQDAFSAEEERWITLGMDALGRLLVVVYTWRGDQIRLISARQATPREWRQYEGKR